VAGVRAVDQDGEAESLGIVGALVGGFLAGALFNSDPINGPFDISSIVVSVIGAVITVVVVNAVMGRSRVGRGPI